MRVFPRRVEKFGAAIQKSHFDGKTFLNWTVERITAADWCRSLPQNQSACYPAAG